MALEDTNNNEVRKIDHEDAIRMQASSRYLMGDLSQAEVTAFEEHFFDCRECSEDVAAGSVFAAEVRAMYSAPAREAPVKLPEVVTAKGPGWWERLQRGFAFPVAAVACALLAVVVVQNAGLRKEVALLSEPHEPLAVTLKQARGAEAFHIPKEYVFWEARFRLPAVDAASYLCEIERGGKIVKSVTLPAPVGGQMFSIHLRRADFPSGAYTFKVHGQNTSTYIYTIDVNTD
jgi:hypothetical protein